MCGGRGVFSGLVYVFVFASHDYLLSIVNSTEVFDSLGGEALFFVFFKKTFSKKAVALTQHCKPTTFQ